MLKLKLLTNYSDHGAKYAKITLIVYVCVDNKYIMTINNGDCL